MTLSWKVKYGLASTVALVALSGLARGAPLAVAQQPAPAAGNDSAAIAAAILQLTQKFSDALETSDTAVLNGLVAADAWIVQTDGVRQRKSEWLFTFSAKTKVTRHDLGRSVVHVHGDDVAVAVTEQTASGTGYTGQALDSRNVAGRVWVKRNGQWQTVLQSITPVPGGAR